MNRIIKFRAWDISNNRMLDWNFLATQQGTYLNSKHFIAMQYTGLKDVNGVEIYEGDICKDLMLRDTTKEYNQYTLVEVVGHGWGYTTKDKEDRFVFQIHPNNGDYLEVVGNIYQNKL